MKTTVEIEDRLLRQAKKAAVDRGTTLRRLIESGLQLELARNPASRPIAWVTGSGHLPPELDVSNREAMWEWLDRQDRDQED